MDDASQLGSYALAGVDERREQHAFRDFMLPYLKETYAFPRMAKVGFGGGDEGFFSSFLTLGTIGIAVTTDGIGTKLLLARESGSYYRVAVDCVANNVNDLLCVGAQPIALFDYIAVDRIDEQVMESIARGLRDGAEAARVAIPGGEIAQVGSMLAAHEDGLPVIDLVGTAIGVVDLTCKSFPSGWGPLSPECVRPDDSLIGVASSGLHSNGYSLARRVLFDDARLSATSLMPGGQSILDALLEPTVIYVSAVEALKAAGVDVGGLVHVSGGGLLNVGRLGDRYSYVLDALPPTSEVFDLIRETGSLSPEEMYATFNMGIGFIATVPRDQESQAIAALTGCGYQASRIGRVASEPGGKVLLVEQGLVGHDERFVPTVE